MWCALFLLFISCQAAEISIVEKVAQAILQTKAYPSVNDTTSALALARLLLSAEKQTVEHVSVAPFPCTLTGRSNPRPTNAMRLKPADIDVVATIGDSIAAGFGALSTSIFGVFTEYRGHSFPIGGETPFADYVTVPNILKLYNPNVKGFAVGSGDATSANAVLNVAVSGARSYDLPSQIDALETRMRALPGIDFDNDWKLLSIFIGGNDLCDFCSDKTKNSPTNYQTNLEVTLDSIKARFPRVFINLISPPDVTLLGQVTSGLCSLLHPFECSCATDASTSTAQKDYTRKLIELVALSKYNDKADFHVSLQPFLADMVLPRGSDGKPDTTYFAPDCFHFSGKAHQAAAVALWNNMCERTQKRTSWIPGEPVECPDDFIA